MSALLYATQILSALPGLIAAGVEVKGLIEKTNSQLKVFETEKRDPTDAEWAALNAEIDGKRDRLHRE